MAYCVIISFTSQIIPNLKYTTSSPIWGKKGCLRGTTQVNQLGLGRKFVFIIFFDAVVLFVPFDVVVPIESKLLVKHAATVYTNVRLFTRHLQKKTLF